MLEDFVLLPILSGSSFMSVTSNGINFSGNVVYHMQRAEFIRLFLNPKTKQVAIQKCATKLDGAVAFFKDESDLTNGVRLNNRELQQKFSTMMNWNLENYNYRAYGFFSDKDNAMIFDLNSAKKFRKRNGKKTST
ncbi:MAG: hypothetical protein IJT73_04965 [Selenomonadaceae bacterium]|nr:hypothetical protein [Selenomonadaceae bacterium]